MFTYVLIAASIVSMTGIKSSSNGIPLVETCKQIGTPRTTTYKSFEQTTYGTIDAADQLLDLYVPIRTQPVPLVVFIHGGGFTAKNKSALDGEAKQVTSLGYAGASINYPLAPTKTTPGNYFTAQVQGARCAIRFLKANAVKYGINPSKVVVRGESAGANLSSFLTILSDTIGPYDSATCASNLKASAIVQGGIQQYGLYDFTLTGAEYFFKIYTGQSVAGNPVLAKMASPYFMYQSSAPPQLLIHGLKDQTVSPAQSIALNDKLVSLGIKSAFVVNPNSGHGGPLFSSRLEYREQNCTAQSFLGIIFK